MEISWNNRMKNGNFQSSQGRKGYPTYNKMQVDPFDWSRLA